VPGRSGYRFAANEAAALAQALLDLDVTTAPELNAVVAGGRCALETRFSAAARADDYRRLLPARLHETAAA
jgi:hypothetical protein